MDFICEAFDQMQRAFDLNGFNDHQLHCVLRFDSGAAPDAAILTRAVIASIEAIPVLGTRYADGAIIAQSHGAQIEAHDPPPRT